MWSVEESLEYLFGEDKFTFIHDLSQRKRILSKMNKNLSKIVKSANSKIKVDIKRLLRMVKLASSNKLFMDDAKTPRSQFATIRKKQLMSKKKNKRKLNIEVEQMHQTNPVNISRTSNNSNNSSIQRIKQNIIDGKDIQGVQNKKKYNAFSCPDNKC